MKKINKKGSHVSMVLSFIIFVVSLIFVYIIASATIPKSEPVKNEISNLEKNVLSVLSSNVWILRINENGAPDSCFSMNKPETLVGESTIALDDLGSVSSSISSNEILVEGGKNFVKVYFSNLIQNQNSLSSVECTSITPDSVRKEKVILESQILILISNFSNNYSKLKEQLEVPSNMDFDLYFEYKNGTNLSTIGRDPSAEVYSKELNLFFLSSSASNDEGKLRIKIW